MDIYITKYALTQGIVLAKEQELTAGDNYQWLRGISKIKYGRMYGRTDYAISLAEAKVQAEQKRQRKVDLLRKQINKLEDMEIQVHKA